MAKKATKSKSRKIPLLLQIFLSSALVLFAGSLAVLLLTANGFLHSPCANSITCIKNLSGSPETANTGEFQGKLVAVPPIVKEAINPVLGTNTGDKHIYVNLSNQTLEAKENGNTVMSFPVSTGKWSYTPTGDFQIWIKLKYTRMMGGNKANNTYYNLPNVPYTMYFYNAQNPKSKGYGLHGAYWHNNFGHPMSHGCVNISPANAQRLYDWANPPATGFTTLATQENPGTPITIFGETPKS